MKINKNKKIIINKKIIFIINFYNYYYKSFIIKILFIYIFLKNIYILFIINLIN